MTNLGPWLAFSAAIVAVIINISLNSLDRREARKTDLLNHRRQALFMALEVIDHVYDNEPLSDQPPRHPHSWDLQKARSAMNGILVYCDDPKRTMTPFKAALGLHDPSKEAPPGVDVSALNGFRVEVARELGLSTPYQGDPNFVWIQDLAGGEMK